MFECAGSTPDTRVAAASRLELDPALGGVLVNAELSARTDVYAAGDVACFYDEMLGELKKAVLNFLITKQPLYAIKRAGPHDTSIAY